MQTTVRLKLLAALVVLLSASAGPADETVVTVEKGEVEAATAAGTVTVVTGQKALLKADSPPQRMIGEPLVEDVLLLMKWLESDGETGASSGSMAQVFEILTPSRIRVAVFGSIPAKSGAEDGTFVIGATQILPGMRLYDPEGNLLSWDFQQTREEMGIPEGYVTIQAGREVKAGEKVPLILVIEEEVSASGALMQQDGRLWRFVVRNDSARPYYTRIILPESAVLADWTQPMQLIESRGGRTIVTVKNRYGGLPLGRLELRFLWPDIDGTSGADIPREMLGSPARRFAAYVWSEALPNIPYEDPGPQIEFLYKQFKVTNVDDPRIWWILGTKLVAGDYWQEAADAFAQAASAKTDSVHKFGALVWQGHLLDLDGKRAEAVEKYQAALDMSDQGTIQHSQWGIEVDREWVRDRLAAPFTKAMIGK